ncbi:hypothetical protein CBA19CS22_39565 [Caballeronia novacaledonica]|uniref:Uncharacterized protein n=1 Tax=Caballeronia novacaledonica TaxID=1544861 RepID=A0ACB5R6X7_9BURK|nr:hypothetical protein CBA19CS22_39565 [Caballeronia novacaledonica]
MPECWLFVRCGQCERSSEYPLKLMAKRHSPKRKLSEVLAKLVCANCGGRPAKIALKENHLRDGKGKPEGWVVYLS